MSSLPLAALLGLNLIPRGPSYTLVRLLEGMHGPDMPITLYAPVDRWPERLPMRVRTSAVGAAAKRLRLPYRYLGTTLKRHVERRLLRDLGRPGGPAMVFTWGEVSLDVSRRLADRNILVVREKFNCSKRLARDILAEAYNSLGAPGPIYSDEMIEKEDRELALADAIFCPSPMVRKSLLAAGVDEARLLDTSYGWEPLRFRDPEVAAIRGREGPVVLFVGYVCVRKGAHILLEAWEKAKIKGTLVLVGGMEPLIRERYDHILARDDVSYVPYTDKITSYYRAADWFIFPTLEEGGPQVTYEAAGTGVPVLVSPMGAGAFARDGIDGIVVDSTHADPWAELLRSLPDRAKQREELAANARTHAEGFTFEKVGARRRDVLLSKFTNG